MCVCVCVGGGYPEYFQINKGIHYEPSGLIGRLKENGKNN